MGQSIESVEARVRAILEELRPFVQKDDGDISFVGIHNGIVDIRMIGECETCPNSEATLKRGIEKVIKEQVPSIHEVRAINLNH